MIRLLEPGEQGQLEPLCGGDPLGCRIVAARACNQMNAAEFWIQTKRGRPLAALCRVEGEITVSTLPGFQREELHEFLAAVGYRTVLAAGGVLPPATITAAGAVLVWGGKAGEKAGRNPPPSPRKLQLLLTTCGMEAGGDAAYVDLSHKLRHGLIRAAAVADGDGNLLSCAMTTAETAAAAVIGGVATHPAARRRGLAEGLVRALAGELKQEGKTPYLLCRGELRPFYERLGFCNHGNWQQAGIAQSAGGEYNNKC